MLRIVTVYYRNELLLLWILSMCKLRRITHKLSKARMFSTVYIDMRSHAKVCYGVYTYETSFQGLLRVYAYEISCYSL